MATVFKRKNSRYWQAAYSGVSGKRVYKTTGESKKGKALAVAAEMESRARNLDPAGQQEQRALLAVLEEATAQALRGKLTLDLAKDHLNRLLALSGGGQLAEVPSIEQWFGGWLKDKRHGTSPGTFERYQSIVVQFLGFLAPERKTAPLSSLKVEEVRNFRDRQLEEGRSASTVNLVLKTIRVAINPAVQQGFLRINPAEAVDTLRARRAPKTAFTFEQVMALAATAREKADHSRTARERDLYRDWEIAILTAYYTGQRQSDVVNLKASQVDLSSGAIRFQQQKTGTDLVIPLRPELADALRRHIPSGPGEVAMFSMLAGKTSAGSNGLSGMFRRLMAAAGIESTGSLGKGKGRGRRDLSFHSLRHAFNTHLAEAGVPQEVRQLLTGHASSAVNDRYTHLGLETLRQAIERLPRAKG